MATFAGIPTSMSSAPIPPRMTPAPTLPFPSVTLPRQGGLGPPQTIANGTPPKSQMQGKADTIVTASNTYADPDNKEDLVLAPAFMVGRKTTGNRLFTLPHLNAHLLECAAEKNLGGRKTARGRCSTENDMFTDIEVFLRQVTFVGYILAFSHPNEGIGKNRSGFKSLDVTTQYQGLIHNVPNLWGKEIKEGDELVFAVQYVRNESSKSIRTWNDTTIANQAPVFDYLKVVPKICEGGVPVGLSSYRYREITPLDMDGTPSDPILIKETIPAVIIPVGVVKSIMGNPTAGDVEDALTSRLGYRKMRTQGAMIDIVMTPRGKREKFLTP